MDLSAGKALPVWCRQEAQSPGCAWGYSRDSLSPVLLWLQGQRNQPPLPMGAAQAWAARASLTPRAPSTAFTTGELLGIAWRGTASSLPGRDSFSSAPPHLPFPPASSPSLHSSHNWLCSLLPQARPQGSTRTQLEEPLLCLSCSPSPQRCCVCSPTMGSCGLCRGQCRCCALTSAVNTLFPPPLSLSGFELKSQEGVVHGSSSDTLKGPFPGWV